MSAVIDSPSFSIQPITFPVVEAKIAELAAQYDALTIDGINDKAGLTVVHEARMTVRDYRLKVEKKRVELKKDSLEYGRKVDSEAKRLTELLEPIELRLENKEKAIAAEKEKIKRAAEDAKRAIVETRVKALVEAGATPNPLVVAEYTEEAFQESLAEAKSVKAERDRIAEEERQRVAAEVEARRLEGERLAAERAALDAQRREQEQEAARLKAEQAKIEAKAAEQRRAIELENAKREAAEKARAETEQRIADEQARAKQAAIAKEATLKAEEEARQLLAREEEAAKPYRKKLKELADAVAELDVPDGARFREVTDILIRAAGEIRAIATGPMPRAKRREALPV